jgi:hypothetical protein
MYSFHQIQTSEYGNEILISMKITFINIEAMQSRAQY